MNSQFEKGRKPGTFVFLSFSVLFIDVSLVHVKIKHELNYDFSLTLLLLASCPDLSLFSNT